MTESKLASKLPSIDFVNEQMAILNLRVHGLLDPVTVDEADVDQLCIQLIKVCMKACNHEHLIGPEMYYAKSGLLLLCNCIWDFYRFG